MARTPQDQVRRELQRLEAESDGLLDFLENAAGKLERFKISNPQGADLAQVNFPTQRKTVELATITRALDAVPDAAGGYLTPDQRLGRTSTPASLAGQLQRLGATFEPAAVDARGMLTPVISAVFSAQWLAHGEEVSEATPALTASAANWRSVGVGSGLSRQLVSLSDGRGYEVVLGSMLRSFANALDNVAISGDGIKQPLGLINQSGIGTLTAGGASVTAADIFEAVEDLADLGYSDLGIAASPAVRTTLATTPAHGAGTLPAWRLGGASERCVGVPAIAHIGVPDEAVLVGDFTQLHVFHKETTDIVIRMESDGSHSIYGFLDALVLVPRADAFVMISPS